AGVLSGSGTITGPVTVNGLSATLSMTAPLATGNLTVSTGAFANVAINGAGLGQYGTVSVTGTLNVSGGTLTLGGSYVPVPGDVFTIITNDGVDPVVGTFAGLPEGATIALNGVPLRISYVGGTGNDVTLTAVAAPRLSTDVPTLSEWGLILLATLVL